MKAACAAKLAHTSARTTCRPCPTVPLLVRLPTVRVQRTLRCTRMNPPPSATERLSRERILRVAIDVVAREGADVLSMRRLAQELDVWPMSVYRYFDDKDALLDAMAAHAFETIPAPGSDAPWRSRMTDLLEATRRSLAAAGGVRERLPRALLEPPGLRLTEAGLAILIDAGLDRRQAAGAWRALWSYTFGFATSRVDADPSSARRRVRSAVAALPEDDHPALRQAGDELADTLADDDGAFSHGLELLLDAVEARLELGAPTG